MPDRIEVCVASGDGVGESAHWDTEEQALYWVDITGSRLRRWQAENGQVSTWPLPGFPTAFARRRGPGGILTLNNRVCLFDPSGTVTPLCIPEPGLPGNRLNEGACDPQGRFWVGSMQNNLNADGSAKAMDATTGRLWRIEPDGTVSPGDQHHYGISNTMAWRPDGTFLFGDTLAATIYAFDYDDGRLANRRVYATTPAPGLPDGSCLDAEGYLWNARFGGSALIRYAPDGRVDRLVALPVTNPTSCAFGGDDLRTLFVTSARFALTPTQIAANPLEGALLALDVGAHGLPAMRFAG